MKSFGDTLKLSLLLTMSQWLSVSWDSSVGSMSPSLLNTTALTYIRGAV